MSFLRSVIADARPRKPMFESSNSPSALTGAKTRGSGGDVFRGEPFADSREDISRVANRLSLMDAHRMAHRPIDSFSEYGPVTSGPTHHGELNGSFSKAQNEIGMVPGAALGTNDDTDTSRTLSVNSPNAEGGSQQGPETALPRNEMTWHNDDALPETDSKPEKSLHISGRREQDGERTFILDTTENLSDGGWERSDSETEHSKAVLTTRISGVVLPQPETKVRFVVEAEKHGPASTNGGQASDTLSEDAGNAVFSPIAMGEQDKEEGYLDDAELSGKVSVKAEFSRRADSPKTIGNRQSSAQMPTERYRHEQIEKTVHKASHPLQKSTDAPQVLSEVLTKGSLPQGKAVTGNITERKETAALHNTVNDILTNDMDLGSLSPSSVAEAGPEKAVAKVAAQARPASVQASVLHRNPISDNNGRHTAKAAYGASVDASKAPEVKIGQVDVFIEAPQRSDQRGTASSRPSLSLASRHYLRRP